MTEHYIEHIIEPEKLLVTWQGETTGSTEARHRKIVGELVCHAETITLNYSTDTKEFHEAQESGFDGVPGFPIGTNIFDATSAFIRRLPPRSRKDFPEYLHGFRIAEGVELSDFALMGYTGARLTDDGITLVHPFDNADPPFEIYTQVQGYRHYMDDIPLSTIQSGQQVNFVSEPNNEYDPDAVRIDLAESELEQPTIGYISKGLASNFSRWIQNGYQVNGVIERLNGIPERPLIYVFVTVTA
ncbi:MAG: hypothetical protein COA73_16240 [Candidatus Hydrogenedentota bacterium]|nr:MAG: hypothetical protein COA73_16240 [Candidatus Hydrogenedentota bacterium]